MSEFLDRRRMPRRLMAVFAAIFLVFGAYIPANAALESGQDLGGAAENLGEIGNITQAVFEPVGPFEAQLCAGGTVIDPRTGGPDFFPNLLEVSGERLDRYNEGYIVPLYDSMGYGDAAYPPLCALHRDENTGEPVTEWMFCTDINSKVCGDVGEDGTLIELRDPSDPTTAVDLNPVTEVGANPRLTAQQENIIAYLVNASWPYTGHGYYYWPGTTEARADGTWEQRLALQTLVWCISDPTFGSSDSEQQRAATCEDSLPESEQDRILSLIPVGVEPTLEITPEEVVVEVGESAEFTLTSNVFENEIFLDVTNGAVVTVCEPTAGVNLTGDVLRIEHPGSQAAVDVQLCVDPGKMRQ